MKNQDSTEKDTKIATDSRDVATSKSDKTTPKELTDEQLAAVAGGGIQGAHIGHSAMIKQ